MTYYNPKAGLSKSLFVIENLDPDRILGARALTFHMGVDDFTLQRKQGVNGIEYCGSFRADPYTGRDIGDVIVQNGYADLVKSYEDKIEFGRSNLEDKLDKRSPYIV